mmetsp:Transcript_5281/g.17343  ORF Transcript_5281/g.17343 Transcript_5281/m.17343 type:complete len:219 (-) Transcript_5281:92-748(-)
MWTGCAGLAVYQGLRSAEGSRSTSWNTNASQSCFNATKNPTFNSWPRLNFRSSSHCSIIKIRKSDVASFALFSSPFSKNFNMCGTNSSSCFWRFCSAWRSRKGTMTATRLALWWATPRRPTRPPATSAGFFSRSNEATSHSGVGTPSLSASSTTTTFSAIKGMNSNKFSAATACRDVMTFSRSMRFTATIHVVHANSRNSFSGYITTPSRCRNAAWLA